MATMNNVYNIASVKHYNILDKRFYPNGDSTLCDSLQQKFGTNYNVYDFCISLTGNLKMIDNLKSIDVYKNDPCNYLNCWIYDRLIKMKFNRTDGFYTTIISSIANYFNDFKASDKCSYDFYHIDKDNFIKIKELYDYALNYEMIKYYIDKDDFECSVEDDKYIKNSIDLYKRLKSDCSSDSYAKTYCVVFTHIDKAYGNNELTSLECTKVKPVASFTRADRSTEFQANRALQTVSRAGDQPLHGLQSAYLNDQSSHSETENGTPTFTPLAGMAIVFPFLGIFLMLFILYKFTPFASWTRSILLRKQITGYNIMEENTHETLAQPYESSYANSEDNIHHLAYYPLQNHRHHSDVHYQTY
ncbi:PIR Superfamily Protein [Plasmodium ovale wallikeri]|uniref:PIR Superfamily Protein n=1 Tax=Plasmodium ovale wallikeri TaxID=864142 RepID=A0A1A9AT56_PLAOA|nr:PIR Superfamily Protein [Plasmodium ovale wallikeri]